MEISVCIVLMAVSLVMGGMVTYFWLSRKYAQEISDLEVEVLEVQRKGNHYKENIEDKLLHAQNAAEDRKRELQASIQAQKALENKCQQFQTQAKEKTTLLSEANAELKKLRKDIEKNARDKEGWKKEKASLLAEKMELLIEKDRLVAENEFWLSEFDTKKHLLMGEETIDNKHFSSLGENELPFEEFEKEEVVFEMEKEALETNEDELISPTNDPNLLMGQAKEEEETEIESIYADNEIVEEGNPQVFVNEVIEEKSVAKIVEIEPEKASEITDFPTEPQGEIEEETVIMNIPYLVEKVIETE